MVTDTGDWTDAYLVYEPLLIDQPGSYKMALAAFLDDYAVSEAEVFEVIVLDCVATISLDDLTLPYLEAKWYAEPATYDVSAIDVDIVQSPACNYDYVYAAYWIPAGEADLLPLPELEISFSQSIFTIGKCHPIGENTPDNECNDATVPHEKTFDLVFRVYLNDAQFGIEGAEVVAEKPFGGKILDACAYDELSFESPTTDLIDPPYIISTNPFGYSFQWIVGQNYHLCPVSCAITESGLETVPDFVSSFSWEQSSPYDNPSVQINDLATEIKTADKSLDTRQFTLDITCVSEKSESPAAVAVTQLNVKFHDECFDTIIKPAEIANGLAYLHEDFSQNWLLSS